MKNIYTRLISMSIICIALALVFINGELYSRPQYSVMRSMGTKCTACHVNPNYGGQRNFGGWLSETGIGLVEPSSIGIDPVYDKLTNSNSVWGERIMFGIDYRFQNARWAQTSRLVETRPDPEDPSRTEKPTLERKNMHMQLMPYLKVQVTDWLFVDGGYNFAYDIHDDMRYPGQQPGYASATLQLNDKLPSLRIGYFPPPISVDYDDHTMLIRQAAGPGRSGPLIPADYAEWGAMLNYDAISWLNASVGVFDATNMSKLAVNSMPLTNQNTVSTVANVSFHPPLPYGINSFFGVSHFMNGSLKSDDGIYIASNYYYITSLYLNIGLSDRLALMTEYITSEKQSLRQVDNYLVELTYQFMEPFYVSGRYETAATAFDAAGQEFEAQAYVISFHTYPLPYIHIFPEYRIYDRGDVGGYSAQWAFQLHILF